MTNKTNKTSKTNKANKIIKVKQIYSRLRTSLQYSRRIQFSAIFTLRKFFTINLLTINHDAKLGEFLIPPVRIRISVTNRFNDATYEYCIINSKSTEQQQLSNYPLLLRCSRSKMSFVIALTRRI